MNAGDLKIGQSAKIVKLNIENKAFRRRLIDMGLTVNTVITVKKISPVGNPIDILVRGYELILRKEDLQNLESNLSFKGIKIGMPISEIKYKLSYDNNKIIKDDLYMF